jgi:preprotein translocase subunit SecF
VNSPRENGIYGFSEAFARKAFFALLVSFFLVVPKSKLRFRSNFAARIWISVYHKVFTKEEKHGVLDRAPP